MEMDRVVSRSFRLCIQSSQRFRVDDVALPLVHPKKAFIVGALEKEIRLSFAARIRGTLPEPYKPLISEAQEEDTPSFKYQSDREWLLSPSRLRLLTPPG